MHVIWFDDADVYVHVFVFVCVIKFGYVRVRSCVQVNCMQCTQFSVSAFRMHERLKVCMHLEIYAAAHIHSIYELTYNGFNADWYAHTHTYIIYIILNEMKCDTHAS